MVKKKNGFTLIELLAIIVILAIIAVITVPIILNIVDNSRKGAAVNSAYGFKDAVDKHFLSAMMDDDVDLTGIFNVSNGKLTGGEYVNEDIPLSGTIPTSGSLTYENNVLKSGCLVINEYEVRYLDGSFSSQGKGNCGENVDNTTVPEPSMPTSISFAEDSWATIKANLAANRNAYPIGSEKIVNMNLTGTAQYYKLILVNTESCSNNWEGSKTACGVVIEFVTTIGNHVMNTSQTNAGGWYASSMRAYLNSETNNIYSKLPSDLQNVIISTTPVVSGSGSGGVSNNAEDYLYLLSGKEVGLNLSYDNKKSDADTKTLKYYIDNNNNPSRRKYSTTTSAGVDSSASVYWLRSAYSYDANYFYTFISEGGGDYGVYDANYSGGVAPAFRISD